MIRPWSLPPKTDPVWLNGVFLIDKPEDWTSFDVCQKLKRTLNVKKIGHAGTLDPLATGLLIVCVGSGTKSVDKFVAEDKVYTGVLRLGQHTESYDAETEVSETAAWEHLTDADLQTAANEHFTGTLSQVCGPSMQLPVIMNSALCVLGLAQDGRCMPDIGYGAEVSRPTAQGHRRTCHYRC